MRSKYPVCFIIGRYSPNFNELCNSLRFSTHCEFLIISDKPPISFNDYAHIKWQDIQNVELKEEESQTSFFILLLNDKFFEVGEATSIKKIKSIIKNYKNMDNASKINNRIFSKKSQKNIDKFLTDLKVVVNDLFLRDDSVKKIILNYIIDYQGYKNFLAGTLETFDQNDFYLPLESKLHLELRSTKQLRLDCLSSRNKIISFEYFRESIKESMKSRISINSLNCGWHSCRSLGINIPLILIQNLLKRKVSTYYFVDPKNINFNISKKEISYNLSFESVYFDLDETLICKGKPIKPIINFLMTLIKAKFPVKLITRHRLSISKTLNKIGLNTNLFNEIVRVSQDEKKSSFITGKSLFIDNEFPERLDVLQNCKIPVIDLDQIDFFKFQLDTIQKRSLYFSGVKNIFLITNSSIYV